MPHKHTIEAAENRRNGRAATAERRAKQIALDISLTKSPVSGLDMQSFFGTSLRPKALIDLLPKPTKIRTSATPREIEITLPHEVLKNILSHLSTFDLIMATGVNTSFRDAVRNSPTLQRKLFLLPTREPELYVRLKKPMYDSIDDSRRRIIATEKEQNLEDIEDGDLEQYILITTQYSRPYAVATLCPFLLAPVYETHSVYKRVAESESGTEKFYLNRVAALAEHWADMYLTNPPCKEVIVHLRYKCGEAKQYSISAVRTIRCETGITLASILTAIQVRGDVRITREKIWWSGRDRGWNGGERSVVRRDATVGHVIGGLEKESEGHSSQGGYAELDLYKTVVEFPNMVFREWRAVSSGYYTRSGDGRLLSRECQVTADEKELQ
jgi:hypothetical protein